MELPQTEVEAEALDNGIDTLFAALHDDDEAAAYESSSEGGVGALDSAISFVMPGSDDEEDDSSDISESEGNELLRHFESA